MGKVIQIEVPDWVDEKYIKEMVRGLIGNKNYEEILKELEELLDELPKREIDFKKLKEEYYEAKMLH